MPVPPTAAWKLALAIALGATIFLSAYAHAPRRAAASGDLRRLVISAIALYTVGAVASLTHHPALAAALYATGIAVCALAVWLARGTDSDDPPSDGEEPTDEQPPPAPDGLPELDWGEFERAFREYADRSREPARAS
jgi:uncharacterized membrane protein YfcA